MSQHRGILAMTTSDLDTGERHLADGVERLGIARRHELVRGRGG